MSRRKPGTLLPLETEILEAALSMLSSEHATFHGFGLAQTMREQTGSRSLTGHGTLYKALSRLEELAAVLDGLSVRVRSCIVTPQGGTDRMVALLRLDTIEGTKVIAALRAQRFDVLGKTDFA